MAQKTRKELEPAEAVAFFKGQDVKVQTATPGKDGGFVAKEEALNADHITGAADYGNRVVITTVDGQRHEVEKKGAKAAA